MRAGVPPREGPKFVLYLGGGDEKGRGRERGGKGEREERKRERERTY